MFETGHARVYYTYTRTANPPWRNCQPVSIMQNVFQWHYFTIDWFISEGEDVTIAEFGTKFALNDASTIVHGNGARTFTIKE